MIRIHRDVTTRRNLYSANPDRADTAQEFPNNNATLRDHFGVISSHPAMQNLGYILDDEDVGRTYGSVWGLIYELDLLYGDGLFIMPDGNSKDV